MSLIKASTEVGVNVKPSHSQVVLVALAITGLVVMGGSIYLLTLGFEEWGWFFGLSVLLLLSVPSCWLISRRDTDLRNAHPTTFSLPNGTKVITDTRVLSHPESTKALSKIMIEAIDREALPQPNGKVDSSMNPIPNSQADARASVDAVNEWVNLLKEQILSAVRLPNNSQVSKQDNNKIGFPLDKKSPD